MNKTRLAPGIIFGLLSALCVTGYLTVNKYIYTHYHVGALEYAMLFAIMGGLFALISLFSRFNHESYESIRSNLGSLIGLSLAGFLAVSTFTFGLSYTTAVNAALIATSTIAATAFFSYLLLGEHLERRKYPWIVMLFVGLYIGIAGLNQVHLQKGDLIILGSVLFFGFGNAFSRVVMRGMKRPGLVPDARLALNMLFAVMVLVFGLHHFGIPLKVMPLAILAGLFYWLCMKTFAKSVHLLNAHEAVILNNTQIFFTSLAGVGILSEHYSLEKFIGSVIVILSVYFISVRRKSSS